MNVGGMRATIGKKRLHVAFRALHDAKEAIVILFMVGNSKQYPKASSLQPPVVSDYAADLVNVACRPQVLAVGTH